MEETCISLPGLPYKNTTDQVAYTIETYFSQFGRLEVQGQGVGRRGLSTGLDPQLARGCLQAASSLGLPVCVHPSCLGLNLLFLSGPHSY